MADTHETIPDIIAAMRTKAECAKPYDDGIVMMLTDYADRFEAAHKREADSIHRAMVLIAGIEMENPEDPPKLWTALEDAYNALSDALRTDGDTTADEKEAKATGRHFVVKRECGDAAKLCEALTKVSEWMAHRIATGGFEASPTFPTVLEDVVLPALAAPPRNCDVGTAKEQARRFENFCKAHPFAAHGGARCENCHLEVESCQLEWAQMPYKEGGKK